MVKLIAIAYSDIHHHIWNQYNTNNSRIKVSLEIEKKIFLRAERNKVPVLFNGDWIHSDKAISNELFSYILPHLKKLESYKTTWFGISGNHDQCFVNSKEKESPSYVKTISDVYSNMACLDFRTICIQEVGIHGIPYLTHDQGLYEHLKSINLKEYKKNILMLHTTLPDTQDTDGRIIQTNTIGNKEMKIIKKFDLTLVGHVHKPMKLGKGIIQLGATNQQRKTDKNCELGYYEIYSDMTTKFRRVPSPKFIELDWGEEHPDDKHYYYNKLKEIKQKEFEVSVQGTFDVTKPEKLAKAYMKEKNIKGREKRIALVNLLRDAE